MKPASAVVPAAFGGLLMFAAFGCGGGSSAPDPTPRSYSITDLGPDVHAVRLNNRGQIVGSMATGGGNSHAILLENGHVTDLGTLGGATSYAVAINENGQIVGCSTLGPDFTI